jgi:hypothetical protein
MASTREDLERIEMATTAPRVAGSRVSAAVPGLAALRRFAVRVALFAGPLALALGLYVHYSGQIIRREFDTPEDERFAHSFDRAVTRTYSAVILGNSRIYWSVNPDKLTVPAYNFAFDNDSYNQFYYKLKYLDAHQVKYDALLIGVDYFSFSNLWSHRNYAYAKYLGPEYLRDYRSDATARFDVNALFRGIDNEEFNRIMTERFTRTLPMLVEYAFVSLTGRPKSWSRGFVRENGQRVFSGHTAAGEVVKPGMRQHTRLPIQEKYFEAILALAKERKLKAVLVMPPTRDIELNSYPPGALTEFDAWLDAKAKAYGVPFLTYAGRPEFVAADFADFSHLTPKGADKFSAILDVDLLALGLGTR